MQNLIKLVSQINFSELMLLAGPVIVKAVSFAYETNNSNELARLIIDRYGNNILNQSRLRLGLIDLLSPEDALKYCKKLNITIASEDLYEPSSKLLDRYRKSFTTSKAKEFIDIFNLPERLVPVKELDEREVMVEVSSKFGEKLSSKGTLHPYQLSIKDSLAKHLIEGGYKRIMMEMPTGAGKTMTALELVVDFIRSHQFSGMIVWIVDSNELANQAFESFVSLWKLRGDRVAFSYRFFNKFKPDFSKCEPGIVFTSFTTCNAAHTSNNLDVRKNFELLSKSAELIIVDEAHSSAAVTHFETILKFNNTNVKLIGISATPLRTDHQENQDLMNLYGSNIVRTNG